MIDFHRSGQEQLNIEKLIMTSLSRILLINWSLFNFRFRSRLPFIIKGCEGPFLMPQYKGLSACFRHWQDMNKKGAFYHELNTFVNYKAASGLDSEEYE